MKHINLTKKKEYYENNKEKSIAYGKKYREKNKEKLAAHSKKYREKNKEKLAAHSKKYREKNKEKLAAHSKKYREKNKEKLAAHSKKYREKNREKINAYRRDRYKNNPEFKEKINANRRECYKNNLEFKEKVLAHAKKYYENNKEKIIAYKKEKAKEDRKNKTVGCTRHILDMLKGARGRAKKNNLEWDLTVAHLREIMTDACPILGVKFKLNKKNLKWNKEGNDWRTSPSLDRIVPNKGYTKDNVIIVSLMANSIKNQATPDQIQKVATFYKKLYNERGITYGS